MSGSTEHSPGPAPPPKFQKFHCTPASTPLHSARKHRLHTQTACHRWALPDSPAWPWGRTRSPTFTGTRSSLLLGPSLPLLYLHPLELCFPQECVLSTWGAAPAAPGVLTGPRQGCSKPSRCLGPPHAYLQAVAFGGRSTSLLGTQAGEWPLTWGSRSFAQLCLHKNGYWVTASQNTRAQARAIACTGAPARAGSGERPRAPPGSVMLPRDPSDSSKTLYSPETTHALS